MEHSQQASTERARKLPQDFRQSPGTSYDPQRISSTWHYHPPLQRQPYFLRKYYVERIIGALLLLVAAPIILLACVLVKATSRGAALYRQERFGLQGKTFEIIKIRTMRVDAEADGIARWCSKNDPRVTRVGRILRKTHIDELPQLINVVNGEMALVGPRPERPIICESLAEKIDNYYHRLAVKPGITGLAQINLPPDESEDDVRRKQILDLQYIREANFWLDLRMIAATAAKLGGFSNGNLTRAMKLCRKSLVTDPADGMRKAVESLGPACDQSQAVAFKVEWIRPSNTNSVPSVATCVTTRPRQPR